MSPGYTALTTVAAVANVRSENLILAHFALFEMSIGREKVTDVKSS